MAAARGKARARMARGVKVHIVGRGPASPGSVDVTVVG